MCVLSIGSHYYKLGGNFYCKLTNACHKIIKCLKSRFQNRSVKSESLLKNIGVRKIVFGPGRKLLEVSRNGPQGNKWLPALQ